MLSDRLTHVLYRFQWAFCQLEMLCTVVEPDFPTILAELPKTLDETYGRVLNNMNEYNRVRACRLLHCLAVAARPLRVEELAEILTFNFDADHCNAGRGRPAALASRTGSWRDGDRTGTE
jgi:hypothetical protein